MIGYSVFKFENLELRSLHQALVPLSMPHVELVISDSDAKEILNKTGCWLIRWDDSFDNNIESSPWWHIIKDKKEDISEYSGNTRSKIRRGLKKNACKKVSRSYITDYGYETYKSAFERYDTFENVLTESEFKEKIQALPEETEFWAVVDNTTDKLVAFSENLVKDDACFYMTIWFAPQALRNYTSYALFHQMNTYYLNELELKYVSDGARSVSHDTNIHLFLESKFHFRRAYSKLQVRYKLWLKVVVSILYPFRSVISKIPSNFLKKVTIILTQEEISRKCARE